MMKKIASVILILILAACASTQSGKRRGIREEILLSIPEQRPGWMDSPPDSDDKYEYFEGHSAKLATETAARGEALADAISRYVQSCGVEVKISNMYLEKVTGKTSGILVGEHGDILKTTNEAKAFVSQIKPKFYYTRKVRLYDENTFSEGWKVSVLTRVPREERARVKVHAEREQKRLDEMQKEIISDDKRKHQAEIEKIKDALKDAADNFRLGQDYVAKKDILTALAGMNKADEDLTELKKEKYYTEARNLLEKSDKDALARISFEKNSLDKGIVLRKTAGDGQEINSEQALSVPLAVQALCNLNGEEIPLSHAPVVFIMDGKVINKTTTDKEGMAYLKVIGTDTVLEKNLKIIASLDVDIKPPRETHFNLIGRKPKAKLSLEVNFLYEKNGVPEQMFNGMTLKSGDFYSIYFIPEQECFVYVYQVDSSGAVYRLFPNPAFSREWNPVQKDKSYQVPEGDRFYLDDVTGEERMYLVASREAATKLENLFARLENANGAQKEEFKNQFKVFLNTATRGISVTPTKPQKVTAKSGKVFEVISNKISSTEATFIKMLSFIHQ